MWDKGEVHMYHIITIPDKHVQQHLIFKTKTKTNKQTNKKNPEESHAKMGGIHECTVLELEGCLMK